MCLPRIDRHCLFLPTLTLILISGVPSIGSCFLASTGSKENREEIVCSIRRLVSSGERGTRALRHNSDCVQPRPATYRFAVNIFSLAANQQQP
ncbi:hypothetical protein C8F01DRAFT_1112492 [Mycena amicta]|nr:hypothetical protein C8F01DRAFT_1112492 [Mycena amicta]